MRLSKSLSPLAAALLAACGGNDGGSSTVTTPVVTPTRTPTPSPTPTPTAVTGVSSQVVATFAAPWSLAFLPDGRMLVTERPPTFGVDNPTAPGAIRLVAQDGAVSGPIVGLPGNVGILDVVLARDYASSGTVYITFMERDPTAPRVGRAAAEAGIDPAGLAVATLRLAFDASGAPRFERAAVIWRQTPKIVTYAGSGEPGGRLAFSPDGRYLFVSAGDRQEFGPVQSLENTLGKIVRLFPDGSVPPDNPFVSTAGARAEIWTLGHRNPYGLAFDAAGRLWENEMGPEGGDELNLITPGANYGWPNVSYGNNYDGGLIPKPSAGDGYAMSAYYWTPVIAPAGMIFPTSGLFAPWRGKAVIPGLQSHGLVIVGFNGETATEDQRIDLGTRIRAVAQAPDGALWVLEDQPSGRLIRLAPRS